MKLLKTFQAYTSPEKSYQPKEQELTIINLKSKIVVTTTNTFQSNENIQEVQRFRLRNLSEVEKIPRLTL